MEVLDDGAVCYYDYLRSFHSNAVCNRLNFHTKLVILIQLCVSERIDFIYIGINGIGRGK